MLAFNDVDLCLRCWRPATGWCGRRTPSCTTWRARPAGYEDTAEKQARFKREYDLFHPKWGAFLKAGDPYYSPHFRLDRPDFALKAG